MQVAINDKGEFLQVYEVSSHSVNTVYSCRWAELPLATTFTDTIKDIHIAYKWKDPHEAAERLKQFVTFIPAEVIRTIRLIPPL